LSILLIGYQYAQINPIHQDDQVCYSNEDQEYESNEDYESSNFSSLMLTSKFSIPYRANANPELDLPQALAVIQQLKESNRRLLEENQKLRAGRESRISSQPH
jgi:hypothetical protein